MKVFISRDLHDNSIFKTALESIGATVINQSLIEFAPVKFDTVPPTDWIFFYSKNGVKYFFEGLRQPLSTSIQFATIGQQTTRCLKKYQPIIHFTGTGNPLTTATAFRTTASQQRVVFPRAQHSKKSIQQLLSKDIEAIDLVVYNNQPKKDLPIPVCDYLVFTSPLNAKTYFEQYSLKNHQQLIAIGATTAACLNQLGYTKVIIAPNPSEEGLSKALLKII